MKLAVGQLAPDFTLPDQDGKNHSLSEYRGKRVLLYFYPKDHTSGCTKEACTLRDDVPVFEKLSVEILGISVDSVASHKRFAADYHLPFTLLSDENREVVERYGVWGKKKMMGREYMGTLRTSFLIDQEGKIVKIYESVNPSEHSKEVLGDLS